MYILMIIVFVLGYLFIALEHPLKIDKAASAILTGVVCWILLLYGQETILAHNPEVAGHHGELGHFIEETLLKHVGEIAEILFFLMGAMTIVELVDAHNGFQVVTERIQTTNRVKLLWLVGIITFFFSAALDNLTTSIVMAALLRKLMTDKENIWFFGGMVVVAANAGGAWSPIGDVTTIMLWIGGQVTALNIVLKVFLPSVICLLIPLIIVSFTQKGEVKKPDAPPPGHHFHHAVSGFEQRLIFWMGVGGLLFVPVFKSVTHLPPFMGMLFSLGVLWIATELLHRDKHAEARGGLSVAGVIRRIDTPSVLFFLGILLAVASLQTAGHLAQLAQTLDEKVGNIYLINTFIGLLSAVVDNVPLVAGAMGMYPLSVYPADHMFWELLAYCAGTGGSALIIGSAAGVAIMGILRIDFIWYLRKISWLAVIGYFAGIITYYLLMGGTVG
jgi:Na+/H+ antiporter NhaD/arsenite permease-like protein